MVFTHRPRRRILVVEDNLDIARSMAYLLQDLGQQVQFALTGRQALEVAMRFRPEIVFLDIGLPDLDGYQVAEALRHRQDGEPLRIIALTAYGTEEDKRRALKAGFDQHLVKPLDPALLSNLLVRPSRKRQASPAVVRAARRAVELVRQQTASAPTKGKQVREDLKRAESEVTRFLAVLETAVTNCAGQSQRSKPQKRAGTRSN